MICNVSLLSNGNTHSSNSQIFSNTSSIKLGKTTNFSLFMEEVASSFSSSISKIPRKSRPNRLTDFILTSSSSEIPKNSGP
ncbi:hypothetical protein GIB67_010997, partial [Kingdonia uniflora]